MPEPLTIMAGISALGMVIGGVSSVASSISASKQNEENNKFWEKQAAASRQDLNQMKSIAMGASGMAQPGAYPYA